MHIRKLCHNKTKLYLYNRINTTKLQSHFLRYFAPTLIGHLCLGNNPIQCQAQVQNPSAGALAFNSPAINPYTKAGLAGQCTWGVWGICYQNGWKLNSAPSAQYEYNVLKATCGTGLVPRQGAILCESYTYKDPKTGTLVTGYHVAYVVSIDNSASTAFTIYQWNVPNGSGAFTVRQVTCPSTGSTDLTGSFGPNTKQRLIGFVYPSDGVSTPVPINNVSGQLELVMVAPNGHVYHIWEQGIGTSSNWSPRWEDLGTAPDAPFIGSVAIGRDTFIPNGNLEIAAHTPDGRLWQCNRTARGWSGWSVIGYGFVGASTFVEHDDYQLEQFATHSNGTMSHRWQTMIGDPASWSLWTDYASGTLVGSPTSATNLPSKYVEYFNYCADGTAMHSWAEWYGWSSYTSLGGSFAYDLTVVRKQDGSLEVFGVARNGDLVHSWQSGAWPAWIGMASATRGKPAAAIGGNKINGIVVAVRTTNKRLMILTQINGWKVVDGGIGDVASDPAIIRNSNDGHLEIFVKCGDGYVYHCWESSPGSNAFSAWFRLGDGSIAF